MPGQRANAAGHLSAWTPSSSTPPPPRWLEREPDRRRLPLCPRPAVDPIPGEASQPPDYDVLTYL